MKRRTWTLPVSGSMSTTDDVRAERVREVGRVVDRLGVEAALQTVRQVDGGIGECGDRLDRRATLGVTLDVPAALLPREVLGARLEHQRRELARLVAHLARHDGDGAAGDGGRAAAVGAEAVRRLVGVAVADHDVVRRDADLLGDDLRKRRLVPLSERLGGDADDRLAGRVQAQLCAVVHRQAEDVHVATRAGADALGEEGAADAHHLALRELLLLLATQLVVAGDLHRAAHGPVVVARVVHPTGLRLVRELVGSDEAAHAQLDRIDSHLHRQRVDHPLHDVHGLGDTKRAAVGNAARRLVRVHRLDLAVRALHVVRAGDDVKEPRREPRRLGRRVECPVVGDRVDAQAA